MALDDAAVLVPGVGHLWLNTVGTARWTYAQLNTYATTGVAPATWAELGHTDLDNPVSFGQDGGATDVKGSWQNPSLRQVITSQAIDSFVINAEQILDNVVLALYYGGGDASATNEFAIPDNPVAQEKAGILVMLDGTVPLGMAFPKLSILRDDNLAVATDDFIKAPLRFTVLKQSSLAKIYLIADKVGA